MFREHRAGLRGEAVGVSAVQRRLGEGVEAGHCAFGQVRGGLRR